MPKQEQNLLSLVRSPWILITIPILLGGMWLINNTWIITDNLDKPYALLAGPVLVGSILVGWLTIKFFKTIERGCKAGWEALVRAQKEDSSAQFFWAVIVVFMVVSVFASGSFFTDLEHNTVPGLGYIVALFIDLVAVQAMKARLNAVRMRDQRGQALYLSGVFLCSGASAFANVYTSLSEFHQTATGVLPIWMLNVAPWFGLIFPALILLLSITADYTLDQTSTKLNPENYRKQEQKRIELIEIQRDMLQRRLQVEREIDQLTSQIKSKKSGRTFFLVAWLFPRDPLSMQAVTTAVVEEVKKTYDAQFAGLNQQVSSQLRQLAEQFTQSSQSAIKEIQITLSNLQIDLTSERSSTGQQLSAITKQIELITESNGRFQDEIESTLSTTVSEQIATALQSYNLLDETAITDHITAVIQEYTVDQTDDHSTPIDSPKPLYRLLTEDLKQVIERFPAIDSWIRAGQRTVSVSDIVQATGFSSQFVGRQASDGQFTRIKTDNLKVKTDSIYNTKSVINWLKTNPSPQKRAAKKREQTTEEINAIPQQDTEGIPTIIETQNGHNRLPKETVKLDEYALLGAM